MLVLAGPIRGYGGGGCRSNRPAAKVSWKVNFSGLDPSSCISFVLIARTFEVRLGKREAFMGPGESATRFFQVII